VTAPSAEAFSLRSHAAAHDGAPAPLGPNALHSAVWVDDTVFVTKTTPHGSYAGLAGGRGVCVEAARRATASQRSWHRLAARLGLGLNDDERQTPSQRIVYTGRVVDSLSALCLCRLTRSGSSGRTLEVLVSFQLSASRLSVAASSTTLFVCRTPSPS
jgi:hypothetical protein